MWSRQSDENRESTVVVVVGLSVSWDFHTQPSLGFTENGLNERKYPVGSSSVGKNALMKPKVRGGRPDWFQLIV